MTRAEHLQWAKDRANEYARRGDTQKAFASFMSDMSKHSELQDHAALTLMMNLFIGGHLNAPGKMEAFINGFN